MTESSVSELILRISRELSHKFTFAHYEFEDIVQEGFIIGMNAMASYNEGQPLENYLRVSIRNRLINFKRDNYFNQERDNETQKKKLHLAEPLDINYINDELESGMRCEDNIISSLERAELLSIIDQNLPTNFRQDYLKIMAGVKISTYRKSKVVEEITRILAENDYEY